MRRLISPVVMAGLLCACAAHGPRVSPVRVPELRLAPEALGHPLALQQHLQFVFGRHETDLDALLEVDSTQVRLTVQAFGQTGVRLSWDGRHLEQQRALWLPPMVHGGRVLSDLQFALWPASSIRSALPPGWQLIETGDGGRRLEQAGRAWLVLQPQSKDEILLSNLAEGYRLHIQSIDVSGDAP